MICSSCGKEIADGSKFCMYCGKTTSAALTEIANMANMASGKVTQVTDPFARVSSEDCATNDKVERCVSEFNKIAGISDSGADVPDDIGMKMAIYFIAIECLPYLIRSCVMMATGTVIGNFVNMLIGAAGYAAAFLSLFLLTRKSGSRNKASDVFMLTGLVSLQSAVTAFVQLRVNVGEYKSAVIWYAAAALFTFITAAAMTVPLRGLFTEDERCKQRGKISAAIFSLLALLTPTAVNAGIYFLPIELAESFMNVFAVRAVCGAIEGGFVTLAIKRLLKKRKMAFAGVKRSGAMLIAGGVTTAAALILMVIANIALSPVKIAANDIAHYIIEGDMYITTGDMVMAQRAFERAGRHREAWASIATNGSYSAERTDEDDDLLMYFTYLSNVNRLADDLVRYTDPEKVDMLAPIMLNYYSKHENLSKQEQAHKQELITMCISREVFTNDYPTLAEITENRNDILHFVDLGSGESKEQTIAAAFAAAQRGSGDVSSTIGVLLDTAEAYPTDPSLQYAAAYIGSQNRWDGASHYDRTAEAAMRFLSLFESEPPEGSGDDVFLNVYSETAQMLMVMGKYDKAETVLENALKKLPQSMEIKKSLAQCYLNLNESDKSYELAEQMVSESPNDIMALWTLCVGALHKGDNDEAVKRAGELADIVKSDNDGDIEGDTFLFNAATELSHNDSTAGFTHRIYDKNNEEILALFEKNDFLNNICAAIYYEKEQRDPEAALPYVENALKSQGGSAKLWYLKGMILYNLNEFAKSEEAYRKADLITPDNASILYGLANTLDAEKKYQEAYDLCKRVVAMYPNGADHGEDVYGVAPHANNLLNALKSYVKEDK
ncbi:MAG: tetratricopeptide repeat protein [Clostridia bacterium]|nr:tetratricopeptide repeat protein [Clostridia bacterium]